jgi:hypothetical protein
MKPSPLPPPPYNRRWEPHNPSPHPFSTLLWVSLAQELSLVGAQITAAATPRRPDTSIVPLPRATAGEVLGEPIFLPKHPRRSLVHHSHRTLKLR